MKRTWITALALAALTTGAPALASGSGGGRSTSPSISGPSYDPVEEYQKGLQALRDQDFKTAEKAMRRVVRMAKRDANSHYILGLAHLGQEEFKSAAKAFSKAICYDETLYDAHAKLGLAYLETGKTEKAEEVLSDLMAAQAECAGTCEHTHEIDAAIAALSAAKSSTASIDASELAPPIAQASLSHGDLLYSDAVRLINLKRYDEAITELKTATVILGPHPDVLTYLGFANRKKGEAEIALAYYTAALEIAPDHLNATEYLGEFYIEQGDLDAAHAQLVKLETLCPFGCAQTEELRTWLNETAT